MSRQRFLVTLLSACLSAIAVRGPAATPKTPVTLEDLYRQDAVTELMVAPDGQGAVYCRQWIDRSARAHRNALWQVEGTAANRRPLEPGEPDGRSPLLSPDGRWIAFLSTRPLPDGTPAFTPVPPYSDPATDIWLLPARGGKAIPLGGKGKPYGRVFSDPFYGRVAFSPDGKRLVFVADDGREGRSPQEIAAGVIVVRDDQGEGYTGYRPAQIWVADLLDTPGSTAAARITRLTHDDFWYGDPQWAPDGSCLVVHANRTADQESVRYSINKDYNLWRIDLKGHALSALTDGPGPEISPRIAPDGRRLVCLSVPRRGPHADVYNLLVLELAGPKPRGKILFDHHGPDIDRAPHHAPSFPLPRDCWRDDQRILTQSVCGLQSRAQVIDLDRGPQGVDPASLPADERGRKQQEIRRRLTPSSESLWQDRLRAADQVLRWKSFDGLEIEGVLTLPPEPIASRPYKLLVIPHGGPHSRASSGAGFTTQLFAAHGYAVFQPNFRGSQGYGRKFLDADRFDLGGGDMRDILTGIEHLVARGIADPKRQFLYGTSYGGYMTCWLVGHTGQFRAAAAQNPVTDLNVMWHTSDIQSWTDYEFGGLPWEKGEQLRARSPLTYAHKARTPTLMLHSANDRRCPLPMGLMFHRALKRCGVETQMVIYPDEGHGIRQLPHLEDVHRRVLDWFAQHDVAQK